MKALTPLLTFFIALLFYTGKGIVFGMEGSEPTTLSVPQSNSIANVFIALTIAQLLPRWIVRWGERTINSIIRSIFPKKEKSIKERIELK